MKYQLHHGDCLAILPTLEDCSVDAIVTDPPAGIAFMGKAWDRDKGGKTEWIDWMFEVALQCRRVIKPGGHALVWAIPRTSHWTGSAWEDAGWQVRDKIYHVFGSGFPKSLDVSKAIDKGSGENRDRQLAFTAWMRSTGITADQINEATQSSMASHYLTDKSQPAIATADLFDKLRPYLPEVPEEIERLVCERTGLEWTAFKRRPVVGKGSGAISTRKDLRVDNGTVWGAKSSTFDLTAPATPEAKQWAGWGTALKPAAEEWWLFRKPLEGTVAANVLKHGTGAINVDGCRVGSDGGTTRSEQAPYGESGWRTGHKIEEVNAGRWPANFTHDGSDEVTALLGDAARFFYSPKASKADRDEGCDGLEAREAGIKNDSGRGFSESDPMAKIMRSNHHPTVKPVDLMTYLCRLITPPGGTILDPFAGSGSTGKAAIIEDFKFIGIEREAEYIEIAKARLEAAVKYRSEFLF